MCPDKKLQWFADHDWTPATIEEIKQQVIDCWTTSYKPLASAIVAIAPAIAANAPLAGAFDYGRDCFAKLRSEIGAQAA